MKKICCIAALMLVTSALADYVDASGETYQSIDYIVATGGQWIVTDIRPTCTDTVKMKFRLPSTAKTQALYCSRTTMTTNTFTAFFIDGVVRCDRNTNTSAKGNASPSVGDDTTLEADYATRRFSVNGIEQDVMMADGDYTPGSDLVLFASHKKGNDLSSDIAAEDVANRATYRLYYFELYSAGCEEPKHRLMPVRRKSDLVVGLYDSVVGKFYGPADNSGAFIAGSAIKNVTAKQRYPWNGKVDISYTIVGDVAAEVTQSGEVAVLKVAAIDKTANATNMATKLSGDVSITEGTHSLVWDMGADGLSFKSSNVVFKVYCETELLYPTYCVIDLSAGSSATSYPVTYLAEAPSGGFNVSEYKTSKLVLKRIEAGSFKMGGSYDVTLTKPFYCGLFEVTQRQWELVTGSNPCSSTSYGKGNSYPVHHVSYNMIRGSSAGAGWPSSSAVDASSFLGKLRARTGLDFDLPTEAQWEYACRAGTTTTFSYGDSANGSYMWYSSNSSSKAHEVGTKSSNPWGLYDMHGNVWELCLDWYAGSLSYGTDPKGPSSGSDRVQRGGSWYSDASCCISSYHLNCHQSYENNRIGFRLQVAVGDVICSGDSALVAIDTCVEPIVDVLDISWNAAWVGGDEDATVVITDNGEEVKQATGVGEFTYTLSGSGRHELVYTTYFDGIAQDEVYSVVVFKDWKYNVANGGVIVVETSQKSDDVTIPAEIDGVGVMGVGANVFSDCSDLTSVTIPDSVTNIGDGAFSGCNGLTSVTIPNSVTSIGVDAFSGCSGLTGVTILDSVTSIGEGAFKGCTGLTSVVFGNSVTSIGSSAFSGCSGLMCVTMPDSVTSIGAYAFSGCDGLRGVTIPNGVTSIGNYAFYGCNGLTYLTIPDSVTSIGSGAFSGCGGLASVTIPNSVTNIGDSAFSGCSGLEEMILPFVGGCRSGTGRNDSLFGYIFGTSAYSGGAGTKQYYSFSSSLTYYIPSKLRRVEITDETAFGHGAFYSCSGLISVTIPDSVTNIGFYAFCGCSGLTSMTIPNSVTSIGQEAFYGCRRLEKVVFECNAPRVYYGAFNNVSSLCSAKVPFGSSGWGVDIPGSWNGLPIDYTVPAVKFNANGGVLAEIERVTDDGVVGELPVPMRDGYSFAGWFTAADDGEKIESGMAFDASVRVWAHWVANGYIVSFDANSGVLDEGESSLDVVYDSPYGQMPTPARTGYSFSGWLLNGSKVTSQTIAKTSSDHTLVASWTPNQYTVSYNANGGNVAGSASKSVTFDSTYGSLPTPTRTGYTFAGWTLDGEPIAADAVVSTSENHTIVAQWTINQYNVTFDADGGVGGCELVQDYGTEIVPPTVTRDGCTFEGWVPSVAATVPASNVTYKAKWKFWSVTIDSTAQSMRVLYPNDYANITSIVLSVGLTSIPSSFFSGCRNLTHVDIPSSVVSIGNSAFSGCSSLQCIVIPDSVTSIGSGAFYGCSGLKSMTLPFIGARRGNSGSSNSLFGYIFGTSSYSDGVQTKQYYSSGSYGTYYVPASLRSVVIMDETVLGYGAFYGCSGLTRVTIPDSVTSIGQYAFSGCSGLTSVTIPDSVTNIADYAFAGCTNLQTEVWGGYRVLDGWLIGYTDEAEETIPDADKLKGICSEALKGCTALKRLEFGDRARLVSIGAEALKGCTELKTLVLPPSLTRIGDEAFMGCSYLDNVIVPGGVKSIGNRAFKNCTGFTWAQIEHGVESIGQEAFYGCWRITEVDIPSSVSSIGANAFGGDSSITKIALRGDSRKVSEIFSTYAQITEATVKPGTGALVDGLFSGCRSLETVRFIGNCPALANDGQKLYENTPSGSWNGLVTYIDKDSTGWDGTPGSHVLPMKWPLEGNYRREIMYTDAVSTPCVVTFDANGGMPKTQSEEQISESLFVLPNEPARAGYVFMGWWTEKNGGVKVTDETVFLTGVYETLYAHWLSERVVQAQVLEKVFSGVVTVELGEDGHIVVTLTLDVNGTVDIPDNVGAVTIDLNGHNMVGDDGAPEETALPSGPAIRIVKGDGESGGGVAATRLAIVDTSEGEKGQILGGGESAGIEVAEDAATGVKLDVEEGVGVFNGDGSEQELKPMPVGTGKVTVPKSWKTGQKVTWKATADKGSVFAHWDGPLVDSLNLTKNERRNPSLAFAVPEGFETNMVTAVFIPIDDDGLYSLGITQTEFELKEAVSDVRVSDDSQSYVTATASGLPTGLKFDAKKMAITGTPTKSGVYWVQIKAKNASGYQWAENVRVTVSGDGKEAKEPKLTRTAYYPLTVICANEGGTASGTGVYAEGKKVSVKATPAKGYVFAGWHETANSEKGTVNGVDGVDYRSASLNMTVPETRYVFALFATKEDDADSLKVAVEDVTTEKDGTIALDLGACVASLSLPKLAVSGLPSGVKYDAKTLKLTGKATKPGVYTVTVKATNAAVTKATDASTATFRITVPNFECAALPGLKPETDAYGIVRSGVIFDDGLVDCTPADGWSVKVAGLPSGLKWDAKTGKIVGVPTAKAGSYTVTFTASKKGEANQIATITLNVEALPDWVVGTFYGKNVARGLRGTWTCPQQFTVTISANGKISMKTVSPGEGAESRTAQLTECREDGSFAFSFHYASGRKGKDGYSEGDCAGVISPVAYGEDGALLGCLTTQDIGVCDEDDDPFESKGVVYQSLYSRKPAVSGLPVFGKDNIRVVPVKSDCSDGEVTLKFGTKGAVTAAWSGTKPIATCSSYISPYARDADGTVHAKLWLTFLDKTRIDGYGDFVQTGFEFDLLIPAADKVSASDVDVVSARLTSIIADVLNGDDVELVQQ